MKLMKSIGQSQIFLEMLILVKNLNKPVIGTLDLTFPSDFLVSCDFKVTLTVFSIYYE